jgi:hypothetical protein
MQKNRISKAARGNSGGPYLKRHLVVMFTQGKSPGLLLQLLSLETKIFAMRSGRRGRKYANLSVIRDLLDGMQNEGNFDTP